MKRISCARRTGETLGKIIAEQPECTTIIIILLLYSVSRAAVVLLHTFFFFYNLKISNVSLVSRFNE